jgi:ammonia channel protein AmtB
MQKEKLLKNFLTERIRIVGFLVLISVWEVLVYYPVAHSIWGEGLQKYLFSRNTQNV